MVNLAGETIRWEPLGHCVGFEKRPIDSLGRSTQHTVEPDDVRGHDYFASRCLVMPSGMVNFVNAAYSDTKNVTSVIQGGELRGIKGHPQPFGRSTERRS